MKVYVADYKPQENATEQNPTPYNIEYSKRPVWTLEFVRQAESECNNLNSMRVHIGQHYCKFSVEELPEGVFAVVCLTHPDAPETFSK
ncbi:MAG: hypothetical protein LAN70_09925 [Acidobacteriia bacterium]|nr:hypothetical protein [Terriglobia bacterium]